MTWRMVMRLWRSDPEFRHGLRLVVAMPYLLWAMYEVDKSGKALRLADDATASAIVVHCWLLLVPIAVHGLYCWARRPRGKK